MFGFALWDAAKQGLLLARDPYGIKPLYYADDGWTVRFASQVKALVGGGKVSRDPDPAGWAGFFLFGSVPEPYTVHRAVRAVEAGTTLWIDRSGPARPTRYFSVSLPLAAADKPMRGAAADAGGRVRAALLDSVRHHLVADVPVGLFLSSGIDSAALLERLDGVVIPGGADVNPALSGQSLDQRTVCVHDLVSPQAAARP